MRIAITGASGMIGGALAAAWQPADEIVAVSRHATPGAIAWDPDRGVLDKTALEGFDVVINLAGENLASGRWTSARKHRIWSSRVRGTELLCDRLAQLAHPPAVLLSVSAVGYYGDAGDRRLDESAPAGSDFLAELCVAWEAACNTARAAAIRVVHPRFGMVLSRTGGSLAKLLPPFRLGVGGPFGDGAQWMSWIAIDDVIGAMRTAIDNVSLRGPINFVSPHPVPNREFARTLGHVLHRPAAVTVPAWALRLALGEMADATLLASQRAVPTVLDVIGYRWQFPDLRSALESIVPR